MESVDLVHIDQFVGSLCLDPFIFHEIKAMIYFYLSLDCVFSHTLVELSGVATWVASLSGVAMLVALPWWLGKK